MNMMKKAFITMALLTWLVYANHVSYAAVENIVVYPSQSAFESELSCDQVFDANTPWLHLEWDVVKGVENHFKRFEKAYQFWDTWTNSSSQSQYINQHIEAIVGSHYLDAWDNWQWSQELMDAGYEITPGSVNFPILQTGLVNWRMNDHPAVRTNATKDSYDFMLAYVIDYDSSNNYPDASDDIRHVECAYYSITWCGDGVLDSEYEICDPNDPSKTAWGNGGCSNTCEPIIIQNETSCDAVSVGVLEWQSPFSTSVSCQASNASSYQINCGNGQIINGATGTCSYSAQGDFNIKCSVDGGITSPWCQQEVRVTSPSPSIRVDKLDGNWADLDANRGNDTQTVVQWSDAAFDITITNIGTEGLKNITLLDSRAPACAGTLDFATDTINWNSVIYSGWGNHNDNILQIWETVSYNCIQGNTQSNYTNSVTVRGNGVVSNILVSDVDTTEVLLDSNPDDVTCDVLTASSTSWISPLSVSMSCSGTNNSSFLIDCGNGQLINAATGTCTYSSDQTYVARCSVDGTITSPSCVQNVTVTPPSPPVNSCLNLTANPVSGQDTLTSTLTCTGTGATSYQIDCGNGTTIDSSTGTCSYDSVWSYTATCSVNGDPIISACTQTLTVTPPPSSVCGDGIRQSGEACDYNDPSRSWWGTWSPGCSLSCTPNNGWGGWWSSPSCTGIELSKDTFPGTGNFSTSVRCLWNSESDVFKLDCKNGWLPLLKTWKNGAWWKYADFNCSYTGSLLSTTILRPECFVNGNSSATIDSSWYRSSIACVWKITQWNSWWGGGWWGWWGTPNSCGDGVIQRPNSSGFYEECERMVNGTSLWSFPNYCNSNCTYKEFTIPGEGSITLYPGENMIVGDEVDIFNQSGDLYKPFVRNTSSNGEDISADALCVYKPSSSSAIEGNKVQCTMIPGWVLRPWRFYEFNGVPIQVSNSDIIPVNQDYQDVDLITTLALDYNRDGSISTSEVLDQAFFRKIMRVRVTKPSIVTTWGGSSFVGSSGNNISNIENVASGGFAGWDNKNYVGSVVSPSNNTSSYTKEVNDSGIVNDVQNQWSEYSQGFNESIDDITPASSVFVNSLDDFESYNGIENVYIIKGKNFKPNAWFLSWITGPKTYIIENGNFHIDSDITYPDNIAFVVKGGNIIIKETVEQITGTYISIPKSSGGWAIKSDGNKTKNILHLQGSFYGDLSDLIAHRIYVKDNGNGMIDVGTIVSFGSSVFRKPAPLTTTFINEYLDATKVAQ